MASSDPQRQEGRASSDAPPAKPPSLLPELEALIEDALGLSYTSESGAERILTGNHYQSVQLRKERTTGARASRGDVLDQIRFGDKTVLDLGSNLGEISRDVRRRGAALVDGYEYDPFFVEVAQAINALNGITRVSMWRRDITQPDTFDEHYDVVLAFSVWIYIRGVVAHVASITRELLVLETHKLQDNLESEYLAPLTRFFPYYAVLGETEWLQEGGEEKRAVIAFARTRDALVPHLRKPAIVQRHVSVASGARRIDPRRTSWYDTFFRTFAFPSADAVLAALAAIEIDIDALDWSASVAGEMSGWRYWLVFLKGYCEFRSSGSVTTANVYVRYLVEYFGPGGGDPGLQSELADPEQAVARAAVRFDLVDLIQRSVTSGSSDAVSPIILAVRPHPSSVAKTLYECETGIPIEAALVDGYHRLFIARLFGLDELPARIVVQERSDLEDGGIQVERATIARSVLHIEGWVSASTEADALEVWSGNSFVSRVGLRRDGRDADDEEVRLAVAVEARLPSEAKSEPVRLLGTRDWLPVAELQLVVDPTERSRLIPAAH